MAEIEEVFVLAGSDANGHGAQTERGFLVKAGSVARKELAPSARKPPNNLHLVHQRLLAEGIIEEHNGQWRFTKDHLFDSPSGAASAILGRVANGWTEWRLPDGRTLSQVKRVSRNQQTSILTEAQKQQIAERHKQLVEEGKLATQQQLTKEYALFRERFGPAVLSSVDGEALLTLMHDHSNRDSLVYWLEFKDDEEFHTRRFGSIAGGSALKFRLFRRKETGTWQAGGEKANHPVDISTDEAIEYARSHRDELVRGAALLEELPENATDEDYAHLQDQMDELAREVSRLAWGHKYFSLLFPHKLDNFHSPGWQRFILLKLLQLPPEGDGRYVCAGRFVAISRETGLPSVTLDAVLAALHGTRHRYWRIGTRTADGKSSFWEMMKQRAAVAVGWARLKDLSWVEAKKSSREKLKNAIRETYVDRHPSAVGNDCSQITKFVAELAEGDIVLAADGSTILGIGKVKGEYEYVDGLEFPHQRSVEWLDLDEWRMPAAEGLRSTIREIRRHSENILEAERRLQSVKRRIVEVESSPPPRLSGIPGRIQSILERKGQVILYGPPGTGKTYWAEKTALDLAALSAFGRLFHSLRDTEKQAVVGDGQATGLVRLCCFHPAYGYEDFLEGYRPETLNGQVAFKLRDGIFKRLCRDAANSPDRNFYLIVDEINRGDIPRIFGELLTTLEKDKRGKRIVLPVSQEVFAVPRNVLLIGTMNTADRSVSLLDAALRRRFGFVEMMPDGTVFKDSAVAGIPLRAWFDALNSRIREHVGRDARNLQIGHSYLLQAGSPLKDLAALKRAVRDDIIPLLEEYCYEDYTTLETILGDQLVDSAGQRIRHELFDDGQEGDLIQALLAPCPDISTSSEAVSSEESLTVDGEEYDEDDQGEVEDA
jgi:5-methylcytosine-specific restriction enzyme B